MELKEYMEQELKQYVDKKMSSTWEIDSLCYKLLKAWARDNGYNEIDFYASQDRSYVYLKYKGYGLGYVKFKKKKLDTHYGCFGNYCDWAYAEFTVYRNADDTMEQIMEFDQQIMAKDDAKALLKKRGKDLLLEIMSRYNLDKYKAAEICNAAASAKWDLE